MSGANYWHHHSVEVAAKLKAAETERDEARATIEGLLTDLLALRAQLAAQGEPWGYCYPSVAVSLMADCVYRNLKDAVHDARGAEVFPVYRAARAAGGTSALDGYGLESGSQKEKENQ